MTEADQTCTNMKYKLTDETQELNGKELHRIVCVTAFASVAVGETGGWVESKDNLSQDGNAWVYGDAQVSGNARVSGDAWVSGNARVSGDARVSGNAWVSGDARVFGDARVYGNARVYGDALVSGDARVYGNAWVSENALVSENARVYGDARVFGDALVSGDARVMSEKDYIVLKNTWSSGRYITYTASNGKWSVGCFYGTGEELVAKAFTDSELSGKCYEAAVKFVEQLERIKKENA